MDLSAFGSNPIWALVAIVAILTTAWLLASQKLKIKKSKEGLVIGDVNDPGRPEEEFKKLCQSVAAISQKQDILCEHIDSFAKDITGLIKDVDGLKEGQKDVKQCLRKLIITNTQLPPGERAAAYTEYVNAGGNGWMSVYYKKHVEPELELTMEQRLEGKPL